VLVIDDNRLDRKIAKESLLGAGFDVEEAPDGPTGLKLLYGIRPDLVLLDVMMPAMDGWTVCSRIRELSDTPVVLLTSLNREEEMVRGLELGADDFVAKPISPSHLVARVRAVLRRAQTHGTPSGALHYDDGLLSIDAGRHLVNVDGRTLDLTPTEYRLLTTLAAQPDQLHSYRALLSTVWGPEYVDDLDFLRVYVWRLRKKLEAAASGRRWILNERGFGYRLTNIRAR
jgi:two-component system KDP operon response regulator KdpE